ncbi:phosphatase PAP2 family protein [Pseudomonas sp. KFB-139]|uniref:Phosphatase PAP2 family protein n=1 Tax=Pseudomonas serbiensis TaxID=3064350 RepID=A0ABT9CXC8_9PSED|nr:phosphatase PAP2 family protein [Pseudomonas sp. KFB-138]MDO7930085.1 phosphatase PAP2 family protein [Pseudomonas sp. KFB-138]
MNTLKNRFYLMNVGIPLLLAALVFVVFDLTELDVTLSNLLYDPVTQVFPFQHDRLFENLTHRWPRIIPDWTGELAIIGALLSFVWPRFKADKHQRLIATLERLRIARVLKFLARHRRDFIFVVVAFAITTGMVHYFKSHTSVYCPVETTLYGGTQEKKEWFENFNLLHEAGKGRCWPGGHASSGFTLLALYFVARRYRWRHARKLLGWVLLLGMVYGTTRVLQGWHFMSHTFWSGILVWLTMLLTALFFYGRPALQASLEPGNNQLNPLPTSTPYPPASPRPPVPHRQ